MIHHELHQRIIENRDWATFVFVLTLVLIVFVRTNFENRFHDFSRIIISDKYTKIYKDSIHLMTIFNVVLFVVNLVSLSFFALLVLSHFHYGSKTDWVLFVRIFTLLTVFILSKYLVEKIIATTFGIDEIVEEFNLQKVTFRTYIGLFLLPISIVLYYGDFLSNSLIFIILVVLFIINIIVYIIFLKNYQNLIFSKLLYFILYLCTLEIAPYYFIYYLITKKS